MNKKVIIRLMTALTIVGGLLLSSPATSNVEAKPKTFHSISNRGSSLVIDNDDWTFTEECISDGYAPPGENTSPLRTTITSKGNLVTARG